MRITQVQEVSEVPHSVGHLSEPGVDLGHTWVDPAERGNIKQLLEMRHHGGQGVASRTPGLLAGRQKGFQEELYDLQQLKLTAEVPAGHQQQHSPTACPPAAPCPPPSPSLKRRY